VASLSDRYISGRQLPDKAIDLIRRGAPRLFTGRGVRVQGWGCATIAEHEHQSRETSRQNRP
jgi:ATP-dependent Clp protease ATP-binding subunit ClpA